MGSVLAGISRAFGQIGDPAFTRVMLIGVAGAMVVFILLWIFTAWLLGLVPWTELPLVGWIFDWIAGVLGTLGDWIGIVGDIAFGGVMLTVTFLLFPAVTTTIVSFFLDGIVGAVEAKHYPGRGDPRHQPITEQVVLAGKFLALVIGANILAMPLYAILFFVPPLNLVLYYGLNGYLVGREFYEMVSIRRLSPETAVVLRRKYGARLVIAGAIIVFGMTVPLLNLFVPVLAAAMMVHVFESMRKRENLPAVSV